MICTNKKCRRTTHRLIIKFDAAGNKREGCPQCLPLDGTPNVRTGKKIWAGDDVYGREGCKEKNFNWIKGVEARAQRNRMLVAKAPPR